MNTPADWRSLPVLIAGCGSIGRRHARVLHGLGLEDIRACDPVAAQRETLASEVPSARLYDSYGAGLDGAPGAVFICTPPQMHVEMALAALARGIHVFSEKPLADKSDGLDELERAAASSGLQVMVGLCFRFHAGLLRAKRWLDEGRIGRLVSVRAMIGEHLPSVRPDYRTLFSALGPGAFDLMHEIDLAVWYAGQPVKRVLSLNGNYSEIGIPAPDLAEVLIEFEGRCAASVHLDFFQKPRRRQTELLGTEGVITVEFADWNQCTAACYESARKEWRIEELATGRDDMFRAEDRAFLEAVRGGAPVACTVAEGRKSVEIVERARQGGES